MTRQSPTQWFDADPGVDVRAAARPPAGVGDARREDHLYEPDWTDVDANREDARDVEAEAWEEHEPLKSGADPEPEPAGAGAVPGGLAARLAAEAGGGARAGYPAYPADRRTPTPDDDRDDDDRDDDDRDGFAMLIGLLADLYAARRAAARLLPADLGALVGADLAHAARGVLLHLRRLNDADHRALLAAAAPPPADRPAPNPAEAWPFTVASRDEDGGVR